MREFRSLASMVTPQHGQVQSTEPQAAPSEPEVPALVHDEMPLHAEILAEAKRFRAHLREAFDEARAQLVAELRNEVLARELALAPSDITAIASDLLARYREHEPLRLRVHPDRSATLRDLTVAIVEDASLGYDDVYFDVRNGSIDASLATRVKL